MASASSCVLGQKAGWIGKRGGRESCVAEGHVAVVVSRIMGLISLGLVPMWAQRTMIWSSEKTVN